MREQSIPQLILPTSPMTPLPDRSAGRRPDASSVLRARVQFWQRMHRHKVYPITVELQATGERPVTSSGPLDVRVIMPGCLVTETTGQIDPLVADQKCVTYVTPVASGGLRYAAVELSRQGQVLQTLSLPEPQIDSHNPWTMIAASLLLPILLTIGLQIARPDVNGRAAATIERFAAEFLPPVKAVTEPLAAAVKTGLVNVADAAQRYRLGFYLALLLTLFSLVRLAQTRPRTMTVTGPKLLV